MANTENKLKSGYSECPHLIADDSDSLAKQRTLLASERTFAAWLRTGLALAGAGLGIAKFLNSTGNTLLVRLMAALLALVGGGSYLYAYWRYRKMCIELQEQGFDITPFWLLGILSATLVVTVIISLIVIFNI